MDPTVGYCDLWELYMRQQHELDLPHVDNCRDALYVWTP